MTAVRVGIGAGSYRGSRCPATAAAPYPPVRRSPFTVDAVPPPLTLFLRSPLTAHRSHRFRCAPPPTPGHPPEHNLLPGDAAMTRIHYFAGPRLGRLLRHARTRRAGGARPSCRAPSRDSRGRHRSAVVRAGEAALQYRRGRTHLAQQPATRVGRRPGFRRGLPRTRRSHRFRPRRHRPARSVRPRPRRGDRVRGGAPHCRRW